MKFTLIAALIAASFSFLLGIFALAKNPNGIPNKNFALFNVALAIWNVGEISSHIYSHQTGLYIYRLSYIGASFIPFYAAVFLWSVANCRLSRVEWFIKWIAIAFAINGVVLNFISGNIIAIGFVPF